MSIQNEIVHIFHNKPFTDSLVIAEGVGLKHKRVIELIRKHQVSFERFGKMPFETAPNAQGSPTEYAELNEDQATFLITLFRNSPIVLEFKIKLVLEFRKALNEISRLREQKTSLDWKEARENSKAERKTVNITHR